VPFSPVPGQLAALGAAVVLSGLRDDVGLDMLALVCGVGG